MHVKLNGPHNKPCFAGRDPHRISVNQGNPGPLSHISQGGPGIGPRLLPLLVCGSPVSHLNTNKKRYWSPLYVQIKRRIAVIRNSALTVSIDQTVTTKPSKEPSTHQTVQCTIESGHHLKHSGDVRWFRIKSTVDHRIYLNHKDQQKTLWKNI